MILTAQEKLESKLAIAQKRVEILERMIEDHSRDIYVAQTGLEEANVYLTSILDHMQDMLMVLKSDLSIETINKSVTSFLGYGAKDVIGAPLLSLLDESIKTEVGEFIQKTVSGETEGVIRSKMGKNIPITIGCATLTRENNPNGYVIVLRDLSQKISLRKETEGREVAEALKKAAEEKAKVLILIGQEMKTDQRADAGHVGLTGVQNLPNISHEINNPLTIISQSAELVKAMITKGHSNTADIIVHLDVILRTVARISRITQSLLRLSRKGSGKEAVEGSHVAVRALLDDTLLLCQERIEKHHITISVDPVPENLTIQCHETPIIQVLLNLIQNACDAIANLPEKWITVSVTEHEQSVTIAITDSGNGIPDHLKTQIMQPFFTTKPIGQGTGLGLSISKEICEAHHGLLTLNFHHPNTQFVVQLPRVQPGVIPEAKLPGIHSDFSEE